MRLIDADEAMRLLIEKMPSGMKKSIVSIMNKVPTIEPEQIVRCKDCKFYRRDGCFFSTAETIEDGFCNWAERKDAE